MSGMSVEGWRRKKCIKGKEAQMREKKKGASMKRSDRGGNDRGGRMKNE